MASPPEAWRLFVALELPESIRESIEEVQQALRWKGLQRLRWVKPEGIHLTLKFLGNVSSERLPELSGALAEASEGTGDLRLTVGAAGVFDERRPRVLWLGLSGDLDRLRELQGRVRAQLAGLGFEPEGRPLTPHLTLARVPPESAMTLRDPIRLALAETKAPGETFIARDMSLIRSVLTRDGAIYSRLASFPLS